MAFVPGTSFIPGLSGNRNWVSGHRRICKIPAEIRTMEQDGAPRRAKIVAEGISSKDAMEFFRNREGSWRSYRTTHHLAFRQAETGESVITMKCLDRTDERVVQLCKDNNIDPERAQGGCHVTWMATLAWDQEGENHEGETVFALVPEENDIRKGKMLRDRGYAEIIPIAGTYYMDEIDDLNLETPYEGGAVVERFSFDGPDVVNRLSTVRRFGGLSTSTFATEQRIKEGGESSAAGADSNADDDDSDELSKEELLKLAIDLPVFAMPPDQDKDSPSASPYKRTSRWATTSASNEVSQGRPSTSSAFSSGFGARSGASTSSKPPSVETRPPATSAFSTGFGATPKITSKPSTSSAFSSGLVGDRKESPASKIGSSAAEASSSGPAVTDSTSTSKNGNDHGNGNVNRSTDEDILTITPEVEAAAKEIGIDLAKVPPSMRDGYIRSFYEDLNKKGGSSSS